jgi:mannose-1-phosphate guanylyltransferase
MGDQGTWAVVLAGGEGERLRDYVVKKYGQAIPKQYCSFGGGKTMIEHAMDRLDGVIPADKTLTVIGRGHRRFLGKTRLKGRIVEQYSNRGTLPGILLGLAHILAVDPGADVLVLPSDHVMEPLRGVREIFKEALGAAALVPDKIVLLGAVADGPEPDYGWIEPGIALTGRSFSVRLFREKPSAQDAEEYFADGYLWNTMIVAAKARALWEIARLFHPGTVARFDLLRVAIGKGHEEAIAPFVYGALETTDFSKALLERVPHRIVVLPMADVRWSDWGRPDRIEDSLRGREIRHQQRPMEPLAAAVHG